MVSIISIVSILKRLGLKNTSSLAVQDLIERFVGGSIGLAFLYCDYRDPKGQTEVQFIGSLVNQLLRQFGSIPCKVSELYRSKKKNGTMLELQEAVDMLKATVDCFDRCYLCIDALDESRLRKALYRTVLEDVARNHRVQLLVTGRPHIKHEILPNDNVAPLEIVAHDADIENFLQHTIEEDRKENPADMTDDLKNNIICSISSKSQGMWV